MAGVSVVILLPNNRRRKIKITPNTSLFQILEDACKKENFDPKYCALKYHDKILDLSLPFRFANIPNNGLLQLEKTDTKSEQSSVIVCLVDEGGERLIDEFDSSATLLTVINHWKQRDKLTEFSLVNGVPVCIYMRQEIIGKDSLNETSLKKLGLTRGSAVIRILNRKRENIGKQAYVEKLIRHKHESETESVESSCNQFEIEKKKFNTDKSRIEDDSETTTIFSDLLPIKNENKNRNKSNYKIQINVVLKNSILVDEINVTDSYCITTSTEMTRDVLQIQFLDDKKTVLYSLDSCFSLPTMDASDDFYELTKEDIIYLMKDLTRKRIELEERSLTTSVISGDKSAQLLPLWSLLRIKFPERLILQAVFASTDTIHTVVIFIKQYLENPDLPFYLYTAPPKFVLLEDKTLFEVSCVPTALIYFGSEVKQPYYLHRSLQAKLSPYHDVIKYMKQTNYYKLNY